MGGWMTYKRLRERNGLMHRKPDDDPDPYPRGDAAVELNRVPVNRAALVGDLNRMERDYLTPVYPEEPFARRPGSDPASECAAATGVDVETVRRVLAHVFHVPVPETSEA